MKDKILFSGNEVTRLRQHARQACDPMTLLATFTSLRIRNGFTLRSNPYGRFEGGVGNVWAVPDSSDIPDPEECEKVDLLEIPRFCPIINTCLDGITMGRPVKLIRPPGSLDNVMEAIEGDGTPVSYLEASIVAREIAEFGAFWHGLVWTTHRVLGADPWVDYDNWRPDDRPSPEQNWKWNPSIPKPSEWNPSIVRNGEVVTVRFFTFSGLNMETIFCFTDTYKPDSYRFEWSAKIVARGPFGYIF